MVMLRHGRRANFHADCAVRSQIFNVGSEMNNYRLGELVERAQRLCDVELNGMVIRSSQFA